MPREDINYFIVISILLLSVLIMRFGCLPHGYSQAHAFLGKNVVLDMIH